jgi:hypothetical protein
MRRWHRLLGIYGWPERTKVDQSRMRGEGAMATSLAEGLRMLQRASKSASLHMHRGELTLSRHWVAAQQLYFSCMSMPFR